MKNYRKCARLRSEQSCGFDISRLVGLDYAVHRYYNSGLGRFMTPDPYTASGGPTDPGSWNRYSYTRGDPVNRYDPNGRNDCFVDQNNQTNCSGPEDCEADLHAAECQPIGGEGSCPAGYYFSPVHGECLSNSSGSTQAGPTEATTCPPQFQAWIKAHGADALTAGLPEANALPLSAIESGWGKGRFAAQGNDFFNLETCWAYGRPQPALKCVYQVGWLQAGLPSDSCGRGLEYALVGTYATSLDTRLSRQPHMRTST